MAEENKPTEFGYIEKKPYLCPVCNGKGLLQHSFYNTYNQGSTSSVTDIECKTCKGKGII